VPLQFKRQGWRNKQSSIPKEGEGVKKNSTGGGKDIRGRKEGGPVGSAKKLPFWDIVQRPSCRGRNGLTPKRTKIALIPAKDPEKKIIDEK